VAPQGRQFEHERHLKAINEAADQLERLAEGSRGGRVSQNAVKVSAAAARREREEAGRRAYEAEQRAREHAKDRAVNDPSAVACQTTPWCTATRAASPTRVGRRHRRGHLLLNRRHRRREEVQQWARVKFSHGVRTVPAGSMRFVDFSKPDPGEERVERFMLAAQRAMAEGEYLLAAQRLIYARDADPRNVAVLRLMTLAFWQAGKLEEAGRACATGRAWTGADPLPTASPHGSIKTWAPSTSPRRQLSAPPSAAPKTLARGSAWAVYGCSCTIARAPLRPSVARSR